MKRSLSLIALMAFAPLASVAAQGRGAPSIAYVSLQRISALSTEASAAAASLEKLRQERTTEVAAKQRAVDAAHLRVVNAGGIFQASRRAQAEADEAKERGELQRVTQKAQTDLQNLQRQLQTTLRQKITNILNDIAKRRNLQIVLNEDTAVVWSVSGSDLTAEVIDRLNHDPQGAAK